MTKAETSTLRALREGRNKEQAEKALDALPEERELREGETQATMLPRVARKSSTPK